MKPNQDQEGPDQTMLLEESGRLLALAGGFRVPGIQIDLSTAVWLWSAGETGIAEAKEAKQ